MAGEDPPEARGGGGGREPKTAFMMHPAAVLHDTGWGHPEHQGRLRALASALRDDMAALGGRVEQAPVGGGVGDASVLAAIGRVHDQELVDRIRAMSREAARRGTVMSLDSDTRVSGASWEAALGSVAAGLEAVRKVAAGRYRNAFVAARPPGHHATPRRAMGFCLFNNVAVAAAALRAEGIAKRVLIVDWDVHHGNGTQDAFYDDPTVFLLSLHEHPHYPGTGSASETGRGSGVGFTRNVPLPAGTPRADYLEAFAGSVAMAADTVAPDFVLVSAGFDSLAGDPLGAQLLEPEDMHAMMRLVVRIADDFCAGRVVVFLEGGYDPKRSAVGAVAVVRALAGLDVPAAD